MMARRCASKMLLDVLDEARMRTLAPDVRMLWLDIARLMQRDGIWVLRFGSQIVDRKGLSRLVSREETETETDLETKITELCERGLLEVEADGAVSCPMLKAAISRSEINRINGSKGGRPRRDGTPAGQRSLMLPINGGVEVKTEKTEMQTDDARGAADNNNNKRNPIILPETEYQALGMQVLEAIGIDPARSMLNYSHVASWLAQGAAPETILTTVRDVVEKYPGKTFSTLKYFNEPIRRAIDAQTVEKPRWEKEWDRDMRTYELTGRGERPTVAAYKARFAA